MDYVYHMDKDSDEFFLAAVFKDKAAYDANAGSLEQRARYLKWRGLLVSDPGWHDGGIVSAAGPGSGE